MYSKGLSGTLTSEWFYVFHICACHVVWVYIMCMDTTHIYLWKGLLVANLILYMYEACLRLFEQYYSWLCLSYTWGSYKLAGSSWRLLLLKMLFEVLIHLRQKVMFYVMFRIHEEWSPKKSWRYITWPRRSFITLRDISFIVFEAIVYPHYLGSSIPRA